MKTITVREANNRIARYRGTQGLKIKELIVGNPNATAFLDREVAIPCGFTGALSLNVQGASINIGGTARSGCKREGKKPFLDGLILRATVDGGMIYAVNCRDSFLDVTINGSKSIGTGVKLENCQSLALFGSLTNIGIQDPYKTGQGYGVVVQDCLASIISDVEVRGARYGVSFTSSGEANMAVNIFGEVLVALVDFHSGKHLRPFVAGVATIKDGNEFWGGGSVDGQFYGVGEYSRVTKNGTHS
jgi:hypothetical protein